MRIDQTRAIEESPHPGFVAVWLVDRSEPGTGRVLGCGQVSAGNDIDLIEVGVDADVAPLREAEIAVEVFDATYDAQQVYHPGRDVVLWTTTDSEAGRAVVDRARQRGFVDQRVLLQMGRPLPADDQATATPVRSFDPDRDLPALLDVNNAAFRGHPEQGGWTTETFASRTAEVWYDPHGIRIVEIDGTVAGFCWVKLHHAISSNGSTIGPDAGPNSGPVVGEIYVIAVHPRFGGRGLGRRLVTSGMEWMTEQGADRAMLYVQADNARAIALYEGLGFATLSQRLALFASGAPETAP